MIASARSSCSRATASSPFAASSVWDRSLSSLTTPGAVAGAGWSSAVARRAQPPMLLTTRAPRRIIPPCSISFWVFVCISLSCRSPGDARTISPRPVNRPSSLAGGASPPVPTGPAGLLHQPHRLDLHPAVGRLQHVVDGQQRDGHRRQRLRLPPRAAYRLRDGSDLHPGERLVERRLDLNVVEAHRMAQRDQLRRALR